ncbi:RIP metalloprotease RseP [bacterium]|nr:RIP metalloprotease RseP [bacterium]
MLEFIQSNLLAFIALLGIIVFIHELGHFLAAKLFKMRVERFSIGFPPRLFGVKVGETDYCISALPFGGYVKIVGMVDESLDTDSLKKEPENWEFRAKPVWQQVIVLSAGVIFNFLLSIFILAVSYKTPLFPEKAIVGEVVEGKPAAVAGFKTDDELLEVAGMKIENWEKAVELIQVNAENEILIKFSRNGQELETTVKPELAVGLDGEKVGKIGIVRKIIGYERPPFHEALILGTKQTGKICFATLVSFSQMLTGKLNWRENVGGPIAIMKFAGESASSGYDDFFILVALLSCSIGLINILPFPALDGGHIFMILAEKLFRREMSLRVKIAIQQTGMLFLLSLMAIVLWNDIVKYLF